VSLSSSRLNDEGFCKSIYLENPIFIISEEL